jgi:hypothetical protein
MIHNPAPAMSVVTGGVPMPPPHAKPHDIARAKYKCGQGIVMVSSGGGALHESDRGAGSHHVSYVGWQCWYLEKPVDATDPEWGGTYIAVGATDLRASDHVTNPMPDSDRGDYVCPDPQSSPIDKATAIDAAWDGMRDHNLQREPIWDSVLQVKLPSSVERVERIYGSQPRGYYVIHFSTADKKKSPVAAIVDMFSPTYIESVAVDGVKAVASADEQGLAIRQMSQLRTVDDLPFRDAQGKIVDPRLLEAPRRIVWQPCLQSFSPFHPFYEFLDERGDIFYVRVYDQTPFRNLDVDTPGGL